MYEQDGPIINSKVYDYGGRIDKRKFFNRINPNHCLIYAISLSDFDQKCYEDDITNRMMEALELFGETMNYKRFQESSIFLVFTKYHIFKEKIKKKDLNILFQDYEGGHDEKKALEYIINKFKSLAKNNSRIVSSFIVDITDNDMVNQFLQEFEEKTKNLVLKAKE